MAEEYWPQKFYLRVGSVVNNSAALVETVCHPMCFRNAGHSLQIYLPLHFPIII